MERQSLDRWDGGLGLTLWASESCARRRSWPAPPGSIAVNFIGEPQAVRCGPWICVSSTASPQFGALSSPASQPAALDLKGSDAVTLIST
jgi:hypothetical protein